MYRSEDAHFDLSTTLYNTQAQGPNITTYALIVFCKVTLYILKTFLLTLRRRHLGEVGNATFYLNIQRR